MRERGEQQAEQSRDRGNFIVEERGEKRRDSCRRAEAEAAQGGNESPSSAADRGPSHFTQRDTEKC